MTTEASNFAALIERARQGDRQAIGQLAQLYEPEVRIVARVRLGRALRPYLDSVDLVQSVHRSLIIGLRQDRFKLTSPEKMINLALVIVRRKVARHWRQLRRQQRLDGRLGDSGQITDLLSSLSDFQPDPVRAAEFHEAVEKVCAALNATERRLIELRLDGYSTAEAARALGLDADVLRVQLGRLRKRLRASGVMTDWL
jgi:RNA polymerase sigma factor (sigma-70 family)